MPTRVIQSESDPSAASAAGAEAIAAGQLVGFATETVYGIAALASDESVMERLRELKDRPTRPFSVHIGRPGDVDRYVSDVPEGARRLIDKAWPGPITLLLPVGERLADDELHAAGLTEALSSEGRIGLRCPDHPVSARMLAGVDGPVVAPSANLAGSPSPRTAEDVLAELDGKIDLLIDSGPTRYGTDSTIVRFDADGGWEVLREGVYDERMIRRIGRRTLLFVCTGNSCRSPMAEGIARRMLADRLGCRPGELPDRGIEVLSAGAFAGGGAPATPEAVRAARKLGADLSTHRSRKLTPELIHAADLIFCMEQVHAGEVQRLVPSAAAKVRMLNPRGEIPDPIGGGRGVYRDTAAQIAEFLTDWLDREKLA